MKRFQLIALSFFLGIILVFVPILTLLLLFFIGDLLNLIDFDFSKLINNNEVNYSEFAIKSLFIAPVFENLFLLPFLYIWKKVNSYKVIVVVSSYILIGLIAYTSHSGGLSGMFSMTFFIGLFWWMLKVSERHGMFFTYFLSTIAHFSANLSTLLIIILT